MLLLSRPETVAKARDFVLPDSSSDAKRLDSILLSRYTKLT